MNDYIEKLQQTVEDWFKVEARHVESHTVIAFTGDELSFNGQVEEFSITGHEDGCTRAFAWGYEQNGPQFVAAVENPFVDDPADLVQGWLAAQRKKRKAE